MTDEHDWLLACRLPLAFDGDALARDATALDETVWVQHFNRQYYQGDWSGLPFRSPGGDPRKLSPDLVNQPPKPYANTAHLARCPAIAAVLDAFECPLRAARFLRLGPDARILAHRDYDLGFDSGLVRIHIPITTDASVRFVVGGVALAMRAGEVWYADFQRIHEVHNGWDRTRIHLVLDCEVNDWITGLVGASVERITATTARSLYD